MYVELMGARVSGCDKYVHYSASLIGRLAEYPSGLPQNAVNVGEACVIELARACKTRPLGPVI